MRKIFIIVFCVILTFSFCACAKEKSNQSKTSQTTSVFKEKKAYLVKNSKEDIISVKLPTDNEYSEKQNRFIVDFISSKINDISGETFELKNSKNAVEYNQDYTGYFIEIESKTSFASDDIVSIVFTGLLNQKSAAHPTHLFFALNFNPKTMDIINFSSRHIIDDELYNEFAKQGEKQILEETGADWPKEWGSFSEMFCSKEKFFDGLNNKTTEIEWYYTDDGIGFSYSVIHALGDHKEVELKIKH